MKILTFIIAFIMSLSAFGTVKGESSTTANEILKDIAEKNQEAFAIPDFLARDVDFWAKVYREWDTNQVVIYDSQSKLVYRVLNLPRLGNALSASSFPKQVQAEVKLVQDALKRIAEGEQPSEKSPANFVQIYELVKHHGLINHQDLVERMRQQSGLRSQFEIGLKVSGRYADDMKAVLRFLGLPDELIVMVFVESLFNLSTLSHAGAVGPWGIVKETAIASGIYVNKFTDERIDPVVATLAAGRYLKKAKDNLTEWALAITSYNYGYPGMLRAVNNLGSKDFSVIVAKHESPIFKYASKSYYAEFLAALDTVRKQEVYFPGLQKDKPWAYEVVQVERPLAVDDMLASGAIAHNDFTKLNPSLTHATIGGIEVIPANYALRVPEGQSSRFYSRLKLISSKKRIAAGMKVSSRYQARHKKTLQDIAKLFGISGEFLSERMGKPLSYRPEGQVIIRSGAHLFSPLLEINKNILATMATGQILEKPPEIRQEQ